MWDTIILNPMINSLLWIYDLLWNNFGLAIIVFTALIRLITLPLTLQQQRVTQKTQELQQSKAWPWQLYLYRRCLTFNHLHLGKTLPLVHNLDPSVERPKVDPAFHAK